MQIVQLLQIIAKIQYLLDKQHDWAKPFIFCPIFVADFYIDNEVNTI